MQEVCFPGEPLFYVNDASTWWIAFLEDEPVGFCCLSPSMRRPNVGYLSYAGVMPEHRGQGLQKRLIRVRLKACRKRGWGEAVTYTNDNPPSANNLIACGFRMWTPDELWGNRLDYWRIYL